MRMAGLRVLRGEGCDPMTQGSFELYGERYDPEIFKQSTWRPTQLIDLPSWKDARRIGYDLETKDPDLSDLGPGVRRPGNYVIGYSFAIEDGPKHYVPFRHGDGDPDDGSRQDNVEGDAVGWLQQQFRDFRGDLVGANLPYDIDWSIDMGCTMSNVRSFLDVQLADPLIYELHAHYSLDAIAIRRGQGGKNETLLREAARQYGVDPKGGMWRLPARLVGPYAEDDAALPLAIMRLQEAQIEDEGIVDSWKMECRLLPLLVKMTRKGVRVDEGRLDFVEAWTKAEEQRMMDAVHRETGIAMPIGSTMNVDLLTRVLRSCGLEDLIGQNSRGDSVTRGGLDKSDHPVAKALVRAGQVATLRRTFVNGVRKHLVGPSGDRRIHCSFNQIRKTDDTTGDSSGVAYGRLSASHPNMQNQPGNSRFSGDNEVGPMWRSIYRPEHDETWYALDLKQQEPKWSFHYGAILEENGVKGVKGALALCQRLHDNPLLDTYEPIVEVAGVARPTAKIMWLARAYGQGDGTLCENLKKPTRDVCYSRKLWRTVPCDSEEGQEVMRQPGAFSWKGAGEEGQVIIDKFDSEMSFLKVCAKKAKDRANERGYVMLLSGRRCHFERKKDGKGYDWTHKAFNRIIQGTAAEQTKRIMLAVAEAGWGDRIMLQVHDELDCSLRSMEEAEAVAEVMRTAVPMRVPTIIDIEGGPSWGESMSIEYKDADGKKCKRTFSWTEVAEKYGVAIAA
jgi:DNA polymerase I-like protein with 3'-5' exonuclease and polymerase domains